MCRTASSTLRLAALAAFGAAGLLAPAPARASDGANAAFRVKLSDLAPAGVSGAIRRIVQAFGTWTLICDEDLGRRRRICNVSQQFVDGAGQPAFNWSLAGTRGGGPVMIMRLPGSYGSARTVHLSFGSGEGADIELTSCDIQTCIGFLQIDARLARRLRGGGTAEISFMRNGRFATLDAPVDGLASALGALR